MRNIKLNLLKGFACLSVVLIHIKFPGITGQIIAKISDYAVPVFFMIAGYYAFGKTDVVIKRRLLKICKIFIFAYLFKLTYSLAVTVYKNTGVAEWFSENFSLYSPIKYIIFCDTGFAVTLWYLIVMIEIYLLWLFIVKKGKENIAVKILPILFLLQIVLNICGQTLEKEWIYKVFITRGLPWFLLGYYVKSPDAEKLRSLKPYICALMAVGGGVLTIMPVVFDIPVKFSAIGYIPLALGLFLLTLINPEKSVCKPLEYIGDKLSLFIYILHMNVDGVLYLMIALVGIDSENSLFLWTRPFIVITLSIIASLLLSIIIRFCKRNNKKEV